MELEAGLHQDVIMEIVNNASTMEILIRLSSINKQWNKAVNDKLLTLTRLPTCRLKILPWVIVDRMPVLNYAKPLIYVETYTNLLNLPPSYRNSNDITLFTTSDNIKDWWNDYGERDSNLNFTCNFVLPSPVLRTTYRWAQLLGISNIQCVNVDRKDIKRLLHGGGKVCI